MPTVRRGNDSARTNQAQRLPGARCVAQSRWFVDRRRNCRVTRELNKSYRSTRDIHVLAKEMIDAVKRVADLYPDARIYNCIHKGTFNDDLYVSPKTDLREQDNI